MISNSEKPTSWRYGEHIDFAPESCRRLIDRFSRMWGNLHGQVFSVFIVVDAAAEAAVGLGILIAFFRNKETINVDEIDLLKW